MTDQEANGPTARDPGQSRRLVLLVTAPTVRAGLLSWRAWQILAGAARVLAPGHDHPLLASDPLLLMAEPFSSVAPKPCKYSVGWPPLGYGQNPTVRTDGPITVSPCIQNWPMGRGRWDRGPGIDT